MAKTIFIDENPVEGTLGTVITAAHMNGLNNHYHRGLAIDGDGALAYAADTGAAGAYVVTLAPALDAYIVGMPVWFKAANANAGAATLNINGLGAAAIYKAAGAALDPLDIVAGMMVCVVFDGTKFQIINPNVGGGIKGTLAEITAAAVGPKLFTAWATDKNMAYMYPGDEAIGLIIIGGYAAGSVSDVESIQRG